jgi:hypothetical protein
MSEIGGLKAEYAQDSTCPDFRREIHAISKTGPIAWTWLKGSGNRSESDWKRTVVGVDFPDFAWFE